MFTPSINSIPSHVGESQLGDVEYPCQSSAIFFQFMFLLPFVQASQYPGSSDLGLKLEGRWFILTITGSSDAQPNKIAFCAGSEGNSRSKALRLSGTSLLTSS